MASSNREVTLKEGKTRFKVGVFGATGAGKTNLINRYLERDFENLHKFTIGADYNQVDVPIQNGKIAGLQIWEVGGEPKFRPSGTKQVIYPNMDVILLVVDLTNWESIKSTKECKKEIEESFLEAQKPMPTIILVGNKVDVEEGQVPTQQMQQLAKEWQCEHILTSAKENINVTALFQKTAEHCLERQKKQHQIEKSGSVQRKDSVSGMESTSITQEYPIPVIEPVQHPNFLKRHWRKILLGIVIVGGGVAIGVTTGGLGVIAIAAGVGGAVVVGAICGVIAGAIEDYRRNKAEAKKRKRDSLESDANIGSTGKVSQKDRSLKKGLKPPQKSESKDELSSESSNESGIESSKDSSSEDDLSHDSNRSSPKSSRKK